MEDFNQSKKKKKRFDLGKRFFQKIYRNKIYIVLVHLVRLESLFATCQRFDFNSSVIPLVEFGENEEIKIKKIVSVFSPRKLKSI